MKIKRAKENYFEGQLPIWRPSKRCFRFVQQKTTAIRKVVMCATAFPLPFTAPLLFIVLSEFKYMGITWVII